MKNKFQWVRQNQNFKFYMLNKVQEILIVLKKIKHYICNTPITQNLSSRMLKIGLDVLLRDTS